MRQVWGAKKEKKNPNKWDWVAFSLLMASYVLWCWSVYVTPVLQPPATVCVTFKQRDAAVMRLDNEGLKLVCDWLNGRKYTCLLSLTDKVSCFESLGRVTKKNNLWGGGASKVSSAMPFDIFLCLCKLKRKKITFCLREQKKINYVLPWLWK